MHLNSLWSSVTKFTKYFQQMTLNLSSLQIADYPNCLPGLEIRYNQVRKGQANEEDAQECPIWKSTKRWIVSFTEWGLALLWMKTTLQLSNPNHLICVVFLSFLRVFHYDVASNSYWQLLVGISPHMVRKQITAQTSHLVARCSDCSMIAVLNLASPVIFQLSL